MTDRSVVVVVPPVVDRESYVLYNNVYGDSTGSFLDGQTNSESGHYSEDELSSEAPHGFIRRGDARAKSNATRRSYVEISSSESQDSAQSTRRRALRNTRRTRSSGRTEVFVLGDDSDSGDESEDAFVFTSSIGQGNRKRGSAGRHSERSGNTGRPMKQRRLMPSAAIRHSERSTRHRRNMEEVGEGEIYRSDSEPETRSVPKAVGAREVFEPVSRIEPFAQRHIVQCETCGGNEGGAHGPLVLCQGCSLGYHKQCLGPRGSRQHLVTKVAPDDFVLQCRRCIALSRRSQAQAPDQGMCQVCREVGPACQPFRERKTALQEERERNDNWGEDPIMKIPPHLVRNAANVLFRCLRCWRSWHFHHLPPKNEQMTFAVDEEGLAAERHREYSRDWTCTDCTIALGKISTLIAWRPINQDSYVPGQTTDEVMEDNKEYLVKWEGRSYFQAQWCPGAWVWGVTTPAMRRAFAKRNDGHNLPTMNTEDAIPEDYLRVDLVLDVKFTSIVESRAEEVDKARIREVDQALIKYKGLSYEEAVWEKVPGPQDGDRWTDFVTAYDDWVLGRHVRIPKSSALKTRLEKARAVEFTKLEKTKQPSSVTGGELMKYQIDGLNWLYYRWFLKENAILADEMGLGKTIQVIGLLATLMEEHACFPFLIVVPNSTCPNWRREIKKWAPSLRVVTYYGSSQARNLAYRYELFPEGSKDLRCHVVITSYEAAADDSSRKLLRSVPWQGLVVDEGHRLKNDRNLLYEALTALKCPYKILLTGTPLQNNARELFNLLQFLDQSFDAAALEMEYETLTKENVPVLHDLIRPFFLRRTKAQVLTFLPPMAQVILPVSMSAVQRKLYMSILAKNPELIRSIFNSDKAVKSSERANLSNILMQLRKCLAHPFVYSKDIEERSVTAAVSHRNLVEASAKLQLLEVLLPKLKERGHRVLIFSQFLDMLSMVEDFLDGLSMRYQRLDGSISSLQKQKRIDEFNAPNSPLFAFLLSTRAGGVGINLATADTVIILDPDFNPHQDIQALSRAHRIGQKNKVLCFQLMTRSSAEEKITQIGRRKMALDHVLIERMDADDEAEVDVESILRFGVAEMMDDSVPEIKYDDASVEKLLDRSSIEDTKTGDDRSAESQFSFARIWANDTAAMVDSLSSGSDAESSEQRAPDPGTWDKILKERERLAAEEAAKRQQALGRGKRARQVVDYAATEADEAAGAAAGAAAGKRKGKGKKRSSDASDSDTDFQEVEASEDDDERAEAMETDGAKVADQGETSKGLEGEVRELQRAETAAAKVAKEEWRHPATFRRSNVVWKPHRQANEELRAPVVLCIACGTPHEQGYCPLKLAGPEYCNMCGLAHYGHARTCPHIRSETQVRDMLAALKQSPEPRNLIEIATKYLQGVKGSIVMEKKRRAEKQAMAAMQAQQTQQQTSGGSAVRPEFRAPPGYGGSSSAGGPNEPQRAAGPSNVTSTAGPGQAHGRW